MTERRGPVSGSRFGASGGKAADPGRQERLGRPSHTARTTSKAPGASVIPLRAPQAPVPPPPAHLGPAGVAVWTAIHASMPLLRADLDATTVVRYADAVEDQIRCRLEIVRNGLLLSEPIVTPRGDVVGTRLVLNPAEAALRRADAVLDRLAGHLGLSPAARARLGLTISQAELAVVEADRVLAAMFRPAIDEGDEDDED